MLTIAIMDLVLVFEFSIRTSTRIIILITSTTGPSLVLIIRHLEMQTD